MIEPEFAFKGCDETLSYKRSKTRKQKKLTNQNVVARRQSRSTKHASPIVPISDGIDCRPRTQSTQQSRPKFATTSHDSPFPDILSATIKSQPCNINHRKIKMFDKKVPLLDQQKHILSNGSQLTYFKLNRKSTTNQIIKKLQFALLAALTTASLTIIEASVPQPWHQSNFATENLTNLNLLDNQKPIDGSRACVTAAYFCVFIVNKSWIDCNLLETLCKKSNSTSNNLSSQSQKVPQELYQLESSERRHELHDATLISSRDSDRIDESIVTNGNDANPVSIDNLSDLIAAATTHVIRDQPNQFSYRPKFNWQARSALDLISVDSGDETNPNRNRNDPRTHKYQQHQQLIPLSRASTTKLNQVKFHHVVPRISQTYVQSSESEDMFHNSFPPSQARTDSSISSNVEQHDDRLEHFNQKLNVIRSRYANNRQSALLTEPEQHFRGPNQDVPIQPLVRLDPDEDVILGNYSARSEATHLERHGLMNENNNNQDQNIKTIIEQPSMIQNSLLPAVSAAELYLSAQQPPTSSTPILISHHSNPSPTATSSTVTPTGSIIPSWMRVPFRWGSISIWPGSISHQQYGGQHDEIENLTQTDEIKMGSTNSAEPSIETVQILRPVVDRGDQTSSTSLDSNSYEQTSIATMVNQTLNLPSQQFATGSKNKNDLQDQQQQHRFILLKPQQAAELGILENIQSSNYDQKTAAGNLGPTSDEPVGQPIACECIPSDPMYQMREATRSVVDRAIRRVGSMGVQTSPPTYSDCRIQCILEQQQQHKHQQQQPQPPNSDLQNNQMTSSETSSNPIMSVPFGSSSSSMSNNNSGNLPPTTPNGLQTTKPLEVSFILYTRHHRDLAYKYAINQLSKSAGTSAIAAATTVTVAPDTITNVASNHLMNGGELIDLTLNDDSNGPPSMATRGGLNSAVLSVNSSLPVKMIIHGFGSGARRPWVADMVYKLLEYEDVIVIVVDWEKGATLPNYVQAAGNTRLVGHKIANFIKIANLKYGFTGNQYHLIGFSLGAHVAGFAGMECNNTYHPRIVIQRITGLDPASPLFEGYEANDRLDPTDAKFVDVIHSNGDGVLRGGFGSLQPMGHVDFYPNGGRVQVGCNSVLLSALSDIIYGKWQSLCNHRRALNFFMDSFEYAKCRFRSFKCDSYENYVRGECFDCGHNNEGCSYMGYRANQSKARGKMYLTTHEEAPFCANQFMIKLIGTKGYKTTWGKIEVTLVTIDGKNESFWLSPSLNREHRDNHHQATAQSAQQPISSLPSTSTISPSQIANNGPNVLTGSGTNNHLIMPALNGGGPNGSGGSSANAISSGGQSGSIGLNAETSGQKAEERPMVSQMSLQSLIVAHPSLTNFTQVLLRYTRYKGWIYSGDESWSIDKVFIMDSDGQVKSFCGPNTILESHITTRVNLESGNCTVTESPCCSNHNNNSNNNINSITLKSTSARGYPVTGMQSDEPSSTSSVDVPGPSPSLLMGNSRATSAAHNHIRIPRLYATLLPNDELATTNLNIYNQQLQTLKQQHPVQFVDTSSEFGFHGLASQLKNQDNQMNVIPNLMINSQVGKKPRNHQPNINQQQIQKHQFVAQQSTIMNNNNPNYHQSFVTF